MIKAAGRSLLKGRSFFWADFTRLILMRDQAGWSIDKDMESLAKITNRLGIRTIQKNYWQRHSRRQCIFWGSQFSLLQDDWLENGHRNATSFFHGLPGTGYPEFDQLFERVERNRQHLHRVQVTHSAMAEELVKIGVNRFVIHTIPIGIDTSLFQLFSPEEKKRKREELKVPSNAFVLGSFQKDGSGWGEGNEPKLVKGPDLFIAVCKKLKKEVPSLLVLLSGPARGYVKKGLDAAGIPYVHRYYKEAEEVRELYAALDAYLVSSRQEGGPKAVLESMATGVPLVSTPVGQAVDLIEQGVNGLLVPAEDVDAMVESLRDMAEEKVDLEAMRHAGRDTASKNDYQRQDSLWKDFFSGFIQE